MTKLHSVVAEDLDPDEELFSYRLVALSWVEAEKHKGVPREVVENQAEAIQKAMEQLREIVRPNLLLVNHVPSELLQGPPG